MLKLKRVELQGFKSFCDRSEMRFHGHGIAAVVGPNGCGKSNLSDAISWVLGEQSAKSLRGARMEDVIFAGTRDRKPLGLASVTLTLADPGANAEFPALSNGNGNGNGHSNGHSDAAHPAETAAPNIAAHSHPHLDKNGEITITRRLYRSGESEYLINGRTARLRDIQDIFMGSGLGPESYAIIEQGRIGQILSTKPQDRRAVIEEAAGITRFKTKKRLAEAKLESAKQNLNRVFDILEEVGRQVNSLKRQAAKTKRYSELKTELVAQLHIALTGRFRLVEREAAKVALDLNAATSALQTVSAQVAETETQQQALQQQCFGTESQLTEARRQLSELRVEAERVGGRLHSQSTQVGTIEQRLARGEAETQDLQQRFTQHQLELSGSAERLTALDTQTEELRSRLSAKNQEREQLQGALRERERSMESSRQQVLRLLGEASNLKNQLAQIDQYLLGVNRDFERLEKEETTAAAEIARLNGLRTGLSERIAARQLELQSTGEQRKVVDGELAARRTAAAETRRTLEELRNETSRLKARKESIEEVLSHRSYTTESVKRLFHAVERGQAQNLTPAGVLADFIEVDPAYEKATEEFLHEELEYVVVNDWDQAALGINLMKSGVDGRATFIVHPEPGETIEKTAIAEPPVGPESGIIARLSEMLKLTNGLTQAPSEFLPRLSRCFLAQDRASAQRLSVQYPDIYFLLPDGVCYHGHAVSGGKKTGSGPLALKRELRDVTSKFQSREAALQATRKRLEELEFDTARLTDDLERLRVQQQSQEKDALALDHEIRKLGEESNRANSRVSVARLELQRLAQEKERSLVRRAQSETSVAEKEQARAEQEQALADARAALEELQKHAARVAEEHSVLRVDLAGAEERRRAEQTARTRMENQVREIAQRRQQLVQDLERLGHERTRLLGDNAGLNERSAVLAGQIRKLETEVAALSDSEMKFRTALTSADETLKGLRLELQAASEKRSQTELDLVKRQAELKYLDETCRKELNTSVAELAGGDESLIDETGLVEAEAKYQELRAKIDNLGPINADALQEFEESQQRYDFLNAQRTDLLDSIRDTEKAIKDIEGESRKRFTEAFEAINTHFRELFKTLFNGGVGEMRLNDEDNASESGIDIVASPPGKKLQSVLLLSGGERAMTAMALLMAIFKYQPSPFCILDEVDAPLDEANIERLTRLLKEMSHQTQFVVITHAKRTMESAQALYGVTMQEAGVSKLVSVKFNPPPPPPPPMAQAQLAMM